MIWRAVWCAPLGHSVFSVQSVQQLYNNSGPKGSGAPTPCHRVASPHIFFHRRPPHGSVQQPERNLRIPMHAAVDGVVARLLPSDPVRSNDTIGHDYDAEHLPSLQLDLSLKDPVLSHCDPLRKDALASGFFLTGALGRH